MAAKNQTPGKLPFWSSNVVYALEEEWADFHTLEWLALHVETGSQQFCVCRWSQFSFQPILHFCSRTVQVQRKLAAFPRYDPSSRFIEKNKSLAENKTAGTGKARTYWNRLNEWSKPIQGVKICPWNSPLQGCETMRKDPNSSLTALSFIRSP